MSIGFTHNARVLLACPREPADEPGLHGRLGVHEQQDGKQRREQGAGGRLRLVRNAKALSQLQRIFITVLLSQPEKLQALLLAAVNTSGIT